MPALISEDNIEQELLTRLAEHGYDCLNCGTSDAHDLNDRSKRSDKRHVLLLDRLTKQSQKLNPNLTAHQIEHALTDFINIPQDLDEIDINRRQDQLIRNGIPLTYNDQNGRSQHTHVKLIDFDIPQNNQFLAVSQLWIKGDIGYRRPDVILYINGLPLIFIELKNANVKLKSAYDNNLTRYKNEIPQLFHHNAFCLLSNGLESRVGSFTAQWEHFFSWLRLDANDNTQRKSIEEQGISLQRIIDGLCQPTHLLDYLENFILYYNQKQKIIAQNQQFLGVNNAFQRFQNRHQWDGKLGVFWHTQGAGKSFSMIFYSRKIQRKLHGNFTFLIVTDRDNLDGQIYRNFLNTDCLAAGDQVRPKNSAELRDYLQSNKRFIFTLIQKFTYHKGQAYPLLSERDDIVVIIDEAHRTQYETLAANLRVGLPKAQYLAFTGTPLLGAERKTNRWFGDYVSEYNFQQSVEDGATVPLFYEKRVPTMQIQNEDFDQEFAELLERENLSDAEKTRLENHFAKKIEVITRPDRLEAIGKDIVQHVSQRGYLGKGMVVSVDKFTTVKMYQQVEVARREEIKRLHKVHKQASEAEKATLKQRLDFLRSMEMAVVISEDGQEQARFAAQGLDIKPHRERLNQVDENGHDLEYRFKDPADPLRLVFVCAMWLTGFDAPTLSTLYLDKPMKGHTLMQAIARANRVSSYLINGVKKHHGDVVDYYNVLDAMNQALSDYGNGDDESLPLSDKSELFDLLDQALELGEAYCRERGFELKSALNDDNNSFDNLARFNGFADCLLEKREYRQSFNVHENSISTLYQACKPEVLQQPRPLIGVFRYLRKLMDSFGNAGSVSRVAEEVSELLDESLQVDDEAKRTLTEGKPGYHITPQGGKFDLSKMDFAALKQEFASVPFKRIEIEDLTCFIEKKLAAMMKQNQQRIGFAQRLQKILDDYNAGASSTENHYQQLLDFAAQMKEEERRTVREALTESELALYDLLLAPNLNTTERKAVKLAAKNLLKLLREQRTQLLVNNWLKDSQKTAQVELVVSDALDQDLPDAYDESLFDQKHSQVMEQMTVLSHQGALNAWLN